MVTSRFLEWTLCCWMMSGAVAAPTATQAPNGPYQVRGNRILDRDGRPYLVRGTLLPVVTPQAFVGEANPYTIRNVARAMAAFERTIVGADSAWDRFHYGDETAISESAKRGEILFFTDGEPQCFRCHSGFNFSGEDEYHNTALYDPYPPPNLGLFAHTRRAEDAGKFKAPTLRNIAVTAPYMHDGSIATLEEVLEHYAAGGRAHGNPGKDPLVRGFTMTVQNRVDLVAFLKSLTDEGLLHDPRFANPWPPAR